MEYQNPQYIPPVEIHNYEQFLSYARRAKMVTFRPLYYMTPFEKDASGKPLRWLKALSIYAIGVELDGILLTLVHNIEFPNASFDEDEVFDEAVQCRFNTIIYELETKFHAIPGTPELPNLNEDWIKTLR